MGNSPHFCASKCGKVDRAPPSKTQRKSPETQRFQGFSNGRGKRARSCFAAALAVPEGSSGCRFSSIFSTAAPTPARCSRPPAARAGSPLAVPETADARFHSRRFDRCANPCSLYPPPAARAGVARHAVLERLSGKGIINPKPTILRRLPPVKIVFDAVLMLYDLAGGCVKNKTASLCILLSCIEG